MNKPVIAVDIDDVLFPLIPELCKHYNQINDTNFSLKDFYTYHIAEVWGISQEETTKIVHKVLHELDLLPINPIPGAQEAIRKLTEKFDLHVITSRPLLFEMRTKEWLDHYFSDCFKGIDLVGNHYDGSHTRTKVEACQEVGASYLIDDQPRYIAECLGTEVTGIMLGGYRWQRDAEAAVRCKDWPAVLEYFDAT